MARRHLFDNGYPVSCWTLLAGSAVLIAVANAALRSSRFRLAMCLLRLADTSGRVTASHVSSEAIPLAQPVLGTEEEERVLEVLRSGRLSLGPMLGEFEEAFAARIGVAHASAVSSGRSAGPRFSESCPPTFSGGSSGTRSRTISSALPTR